MNTENILLQPDSYKQSHYMQSQEKVVAKNFYLGPRKGDANVFFGLQYILQRYFTQPITKQMIEEAEDFLPQHGLPVNSEGFNRIFNEHRGYFPVIIEAIPEGTVTGPNVAQMQIRNTTVGFDWLPGWLETTLHRVWYPSTVATHDLHRRKIIMKFLKDTGTPSLIDFKLHDFGARGASSFETAGIGGMAHLLNFLGTDTVTGCLFANKYYGAPLPVGYSIPASEHSTITPWGRDNEFAAHRNMLTKFMKPGGLVASVSDSYDLFNTIQKGWCGELKDEVVNSGGTLVVRPDSGNPVEIVDRTITMLMNGFGYRTNAKGYKVLPDYIRVIQGDGITNDTICDILSRLQIEEISADNIAFGMGGAMLQGVGRDDFGYAMKCSAVAEEEGPWKDVMKDPKTDPKKKSLAGILATIDKVSPSVPRHSAGRIDPDMLAPVYLNGRMMNTQTFDQIRAKIRSYD